MAENLIANLPFLDRSYAPFFTVYPFISRRLDVHVARRRIPRPIFHIFHTPHEKLSIHHTTLLSREAGAINAMLYNAAGINIQIAVLTSKRVDRGEAEPDFCRDRFPD